MAIPAAQGFGFARGRGQPEAGGGRVAVVAAVGLTVWLAAGVLAAEVSPVAEVRAWLAQGKVAEAQARLDAWRVAPPADLSAAELLLLVGDCQAARGETEAAVDAYRTCLSGAGTAPTVAVALQAWERLAAVHLGLGELDEARAAQAVAARQQARQLLASLEKGPGYARNRAALDTIPAYQVAQLAAVVAAAEARGDVAAAAQAARDLVARFPERPEVRPLLAHAADLSRQAKDLTAALGLGLHALDLGTDRAFSPKAALADNQPHLDAVTRPPAPEALTTALLVVNEVERASGRHRELDDARLAALRSRWTEALAQTYAPDTRPAAAAWHQLATETGATAPWTWLCRLAEGQCHLLEGRYAQAREAFAAVDARPQDAADNPYRHAAAFGLGRVALGLREWRPAQTALDLAAAAADPALASQARFALALRAEQAMDWPAADKCWRAIAPDCTVDWLRRCAGQAAGRLAELRELQARPDPARLSVLPDDRSTRGNWPGHYGALSYVLCAQQGSTDLTGGPGPALVYTVRTSHPNVPSVCWRSKATDTDPVALADPANQTHIPGNRADHGEAQALGTGPDLVVDCEIPAGPHVLALYFVNDYHYYEPSRAYTLSVTAADDGALLAVTDVRDFGGGVYKRLAVQGPRKLAVRVWRDLSMNTLLSGVFLDPPASPPAR